MRSKVFALFVLMVICSVMLTACQPVAAAPPETVVVTQMVQKEGETIVKEIVVTVTPGPQIQPHEKKVLVVESGQGDIPTLDPSLATDNKSLKLLNEMYIGLTRLHETEAVIQPAMATSWEVSDDMLTYTFNVRTDIPWVRWNGESVEEVLDEEGSVRTVTAHDFEYGIKRECDPATASSYAGVFYVIEGCKAFNTGEVGDGSGVMVSALDDSTLEVTFNTPAIYTTNIIGMWIGSALPEWAIEGNGDRWQEQGFSQSYGPYALKEWVHDSYATLVHNPFWPDDMESVPQPKIEEITFRFLDVVPAFAEYEAGNMDISRVPLADMDRVKADPVLSEELAMVPKLCTYYYGFNTQAEHMDDARVRRALSLAIDRQSLVDNVTKGGQEPASWFSRPGLSGAPTRASYPDLGVNYDPETAKALLEAYLAEKGITTDDLDLLLMSSMGSTHRVAAEAIQQMWSDNLGIQVKLTFQEWKVFLKTVRSADSPDIWPLGWCLDYPDANNFINEVFNAGGLANPGEGGINWAEGEDFEAWNEILMEAAVEVDPVRRQELYAQAEHILVYEKAAISPLAWYTDVTVTRPCVERTWAITGQQAFEKWDIDMTAR